MARNEWINGYLEAILDAGSSRNGLRVVEDGDEKSNSNNNGNRRRRFIEGKVRIGRLEEKEKEEKVFNPTKYFVEEVVNSFDESDLHRTWIKVCSSLLFLTYFFNSIIICLFLFFPNFFLSFLIT